MVEFHSYFNFVKNRSEKQDYCIIWDDRRPDDVLVETKKFMKHDTAEMNNLRNQTKEKKTVFFFILANQKFHSLCSSYIDRVCDTANLLYTYIQNQFEARSKKKKCAKALGYRGFIIIGKISAKLKKKKKIR